MNIVLKAARKIGRYFVDTNCAYWFERSVSSPGPERIDPRVPVQLSCDTEKTISWLSLHKGSWMYNRREIEVCRREHHLYLSAVSGNAVVGYIKIGWNKVYIDDYRSVVSFPADCAFFYDTYVAPGFRKNDIAAYLNWQGLRLCKEKGMRRVRLHVPAWNEASMGICRKMGFKKYASIRHIRILSCLNFKVCHKIHD